MPWLPSGNSVGPRRTMIQPYINDAIWLSWRRILQSAQAHCSDLKSSCASVSPMTSRAMRSYSSSYSGKSTVPGASSVIICRLIGFPCSLYCLGDGLHATRVLQGRQVARFLAKIGGPNHPAHDLGAARLGQLAHEEHPVG